MLKYAFTLLFLTLFCFYSLGQQTVGRSRKLTPQVTEKYHVLKTDYEVMDGLYAAYLKKTLIAAGHYKNNKKIGTWTFFDDKGKLCQRFNYESNTLVYEAPFDDKNKMLYLVDDSLNNDPMFTRPVRIGGRFYGYLNYINLVELPADFKNLTDDIANISMELLVSPYGRLAEYKLRIRAANAISADDDQIFALNINLLADEDKIFVPATLNKEPVAVRIIIPCHFYRSDRIRL